MDLSAFFQQVQQNTQHLDHDCVFAAFDDARTELNHKIANGKWQWAGDTLIRNCRVSYNFSHYYYPQLTKSQLDESNTKEIQQLWQWADQHGELPQSVIVVLGTTELHYSDEIKAVATAHTHCLQQLKQQNKIKNYTLIASINHPVPVVEWLRQQPRTVVIPWFLFRYSRIYTSAFGSVPGDRILFTPGRVIAQSMQARMDRITTLAHLASLEDRSQWLWSYTGTTYDEPPPEDFVKMITHVIKKHAPQLQPYAPNPMTCLDHLQHTLDSATLDMWKEWGAHHTTIPIPIDVYTQTAVEYVHETWYHERTHLTEKIFRPILLGIPWVTVNPSHSAHLQAVTPLKCYLDLIDVDLHSCQPETMGEQDELEYSAGLPHVYKLHSIAHSPAVQQRAQQNVATAQQMVTEFTQHIQQYHPHVDLDQLAHVDAYYPKPHQMPGDIPSAP